MEEISDFSQTQRIVFLIDLHPLLSLQNPSPYITSVLRSAQSLLTFPSLSSSLFAFKLFFSSLSPILSSSKLHHLLGKSASSFSFDRPSDTFLILSQTLNSVPVLLSEAPISPPRASFTASSLHQLFHDYAWEYPLQELIGKGTGLNVVRSNMILLFSPISRSLKCLSDFMSLGDDDEALVSFHAFSDKFVQNFRSLSEGFVERDIHFSWIDINYEQNIQEQNTERDNIHALGFIERGIRSLGWGFCSTDAIVLGSALIPFGLIYPNIGCNLMGFNYNNYRNTARAELSLQISDVCGKPLECKCCDLELLDLKQLGRQRFEDVMGVLGSVNSGTGDSSQEKSFWRDVGDGITKIHVTEVRRNKKSLDTNGCISDSVLVRALSGEYEKDRKTESSGGFFAKKTLEMLRVETTDFVLCRRIPIWQLLLTFLYREGYWAVVSVSKKDGGHFMGILKPFTVHSGFLSIIGSGFSPLETVVDSDRTNVHKNTADLNHSSSLTIVQSDASSSKMSLAVDAKNKRKRKKKHTNLLQDSTWHSFYKAVNSHFEMDLEEVYFDRKCKDSKKLRFLKCWMKHIKKSGHCCPIKPKELKSYPDIEKEMEGRLAGSQQESEQPVSSPISTGEASCLGASEMKEEVASVSCLETSEAFLGSISQKVQNGLESTEVDLGALAERLVDSSIHWLCRKHELDTNVPEVYPHGDYGGLVADLVNIFLKEPKDLAAKYKCVDTSSHAVVDQSPATYSSEDIVREYELQILLRMEMLRSKMRGYIEETMKKKMVKQICSLLEIIPYHLAGGFFGDVSLDAYVGKIIKSRYSQSLGDVVGKIYTRMDLLLFDDEGESLGSQLNSEESDHPWKGIVNKHEVHEDARVGSGSPSEEDESLQPPGNDSNCLQRTKDEEHLRQLMEAQERRERARRFASFTSWAPDLQRVWAPKQPKTVTAKHESLWKLRKKKRREVSYDVVCETPLVEKKCSSIRGEGQPSYGINSSSSVSKVLFRDEGWN